MAADATVDGLTEVGTHKLCTPLLFYPILYLLIDLNAANPLRWLYYQFIDVIYNV